jgi:hypothetical protein
VLLRALRVLAIHLQPGVDQRDRRIDDRMAQTLLLGDELHQLVSTFDVGRTVVKRARLRPGASGSARLSRYFHAYEASGSLALARLIQAAKPPISSPICNRFRTIRGMV